MKRVLREGTIVAVAVSRHSWCNAFNTSRSSLYVVAVPSVTVVARQSFRLTIVLQLQTESETRILE